MLFVFYGTAQKFAVFQDLYGPFLQCTLSSRTRTLHVMTQALTFQIDHHTLVGTLSTAALFDLTGWWLGITLAYMKYLFTNQSRVRTCPNYCEQVSTKCCVKIVVMLTFDTTECYIRKPDLNVLFFFLWVEISRLPRYYYLK